MDYFSNNNSASASLTQFDLTRFSRNILLPEVGTVGQRKLKSARVLVIGAGGLGSPVTLYLAAAGVGSIGLVDFDNVDQTNLQRQILYTNDDVGKSKVAAASHRLKALYPDLNLEIFSSSLSQENAASIIEKFDLIIDGTDNFTTRYLVNDTCVQHRKINIYGSVFRFEGQASVFSPFNGPCYRCLFPSPPPTNEVPNCAEGGVLGVLPGMIGIIQATEALKVILGIGEPLIGRLVLYDGLRMRFDEINIAKDPNCKACGPQANFEALQNARNAAAAEQCAVATAQTINAAQNIQSISPKEFAEIRREGFAHTLLDVRTLAETEICRISDSVHVPLAELSAKISALNSSDLVVVHCKSGGRSAQAVSLLIANGFTNVKNLAGGIIAWIEEIDSSLAKY